MTNVMDMLSTPCCSSRQGGSDLIPLLLMLGVWFAAHVAFKEFKKRKGNPEMKNLKNIAIVAAVLVAAGIVFALKPNTEKSTAQVPATTMGATLHPEAARPAPSGSHPRLVELGADKCIPCKMMAPILEDLRTTYAGQLQVDFIDVWKNPDAGEPYGIRMIPTQIFFDAQGKELFRHEGFFSREDILVKWKELGYEFK